MTGKDQESYQNLRKYLNKSWGLSEKSLLWLNERFDEPGKRELDPEISKIVGDDFRARFELKNFTDKEDGEDRRDEGWETFSSGFSYPISHFEVSYSDYVGNLITDGKQKVKISKAFVNYYMTNDKGMLFNDVRRVFVNINGIRETYNDERKWPAKFNPANFAINKKNCENVEDKQFESLVNAHVLYVSEYCGRFKKSNKKADYELVISANWVDWLLASTGERWSSCWNIEGGNGFWTGIPFLFDDRNRVMFYITNKKNGKKSYYGMEADHFTTRSWGLFNAVGKLFPVRWFPGSYQIPSDLKNVTKMDIGTQGKDQFGVSKYPFMEHIRFHGDKGWLIPYLDMWGYGNSMGKDGEPPFYYKDGGHTGTGSHEESRNMWYPRNSENNRHLFELGVNLYERVYMAACSHCGAKGYKNDPSQMKKVRGSDGYVCIGCYTERYDTCESCGEVYPKGDLRAVAKHYKKICPSCVQTKFVTCSICGEFHLKDKIKNGICTECAITNPEIVFCKTCGEFHHIRKFKGVKVQVDESTVHYFCNEQCVEPFISFMKEMSRWEGIKKTSCCKNYFHESLLKVMPIAGYKTSFEDVPQAGGKPAVKILRVNTGESYICQEHIPQEKNTQLEFKFATFKKKENLGKAAIAV